MMRTKSSFSITFLTPAEKTASSTNLAHFHDQDGDLPKMVQIQVQVYIVRMIVMIWFMYSSFMYSPRRVDQGKSSSPQGFQQPYRLPLAAVERFHWTTFLLLSNHK